MSQHDRYRYSVTMHTDELAVVNCLRALAQFSQKTGNGRIAWGGTKDIDWRASLHEVTFHFDSSTYRDDFRREVSRLLPAALWRETRASDHDPATPQSN